LYFEPTIYFVIKYLLNSEQTIKHNFEQNLDSSTKETIHIKTMLKKKK